MKSKEAGAQHQSLYVKKEKREVAKGLEEPTLIYSSNQAAP